MGFCMSEGMYKVINILGKNYIYVAKLHTYYYILFHSRQVAYVIVCNSLTLVSPYNVSAIGNNMYLQGEQLMLNCLSEGGPQLQYSWIFSDSEIATSANLTINNVSALNGGDYTCNVTNDAGSESDTITIYSKFSHM